MVTAFCLWLGREGWDWWMELMRAASSQTLDVSPGLPCTLPGQGAQQSKKTLGVGPSLSVDKGCVPVMPSGGNDL